MKNQASKGKAERRALRMRAEKRLVVEQSTAPPSVDPTQLIQELRVHEIELEIQNEELRQAQAELEASRDLYVDLYDFAPVGYLTFDRLGRIHKANLTAVEMLGVTRRALMGRRFSEFVAADHQRLFNLHCEQAVASEAKQSCELWVVNKTGAVICVQMETRSEREVRGERLLRTTVTDITARKEFEERLNELNATLEQRVKKRTAESERRAAQLQALVLQLIDAEQRERRRVAQILHDHVQQLLVACDMSLHQLRRRTEDAEMRDALDRAESLLNDALRATRDLGLDLSPPILHEQGLTATLEWLGRSNQEKYGLRVEVDADPLADPAEYNIDVLLFQAAQELLFNVVKHAATDKARVTLEAVGQDCVRLTVTDEGAGFDPGELRSLGGTTAVGLMNIRERLEMIGGSLLMDSAPGRGCRAVLVAPRRLRPTVLEAAASASAGATLDVAPRVSQRPIRVLLVDDHEIVRAGLTSLLNDEGDIEVVGEAGDGARAVRLAAELRPDVVIMDVSLPILNGVEATRRITGELPGVQVIALSMHNKDDMEPTMREAGARAYVSKGVASDELIPAIRAALGGTDRRGRERRGRWDDRRSTVR